jgi:hypothetical protein
VRALPPSMAQRCENSVITVAPTRLRSCPLSRRKCTSACRETGAGNRNTISASVNPRAARRRGTSQGTANNASRARAPKAVVTGAQSAGSAARAAAIASGGSPAPGRADRGTPAWPIGRKKKV